MAQFLVRVAQKTVRNYKVAQKVPHRTNCNFSATVRDFFVPKCPDWYVRVPATIPKN